MHRLIHRCAKRVLEALRKPVLGPIIFGVVLAGFPIGFGFRDLVGDVNSPNLAGVIAHLTPAAIILVAVQGIAFGGLSWRGLLRSSFLTSFATCVPFPWAVCMIVEWPLEHWYILRAGFSVGLFVLLFVWGIFIGASSFVLASAFNFFRRRWAIANAPRKGGPLG